MKPDILFENFEMLADAPNGVPKLREMILLLAVQGKLAFQNSSEGTGDIILKQIEKTPPEIRSKRRSKNIPALQPQITWSVPSSWSFTTLENTTRGSGIFSDGDWVESKDQDPSGSVRLIQLADIGNGFYRNKSSRFMNLKTAKRLNCTFIKKGYVLIARMPDPLGRACIFLGDSKLSVTVVDVCIVNVNDKFFLPEYLVIVINSPLFRTQAYEKATGTTRSRISRGNLSGFPIPVVPMEEQKRIVAKVDQLMALCDELEARKQKRDESRIDLNDAALDRLLSARKQKDFTKHWNRISNNFDLLYDTPKTVNNLRQAILQLAVQGKLVPQDPKDLPASVLLEKIKAEKERLIKEKKIKKTKPLPRITPDEIPHELPTGWEWERLGATGITQTGTTPSKSNPLYFGKDIPFIKPADISEASINYDNEGLSSKGLEKGRFIEVNSVLMVCIGGSIGKVNVIDRPCSCNQQINTLTPFRGVSYKLLNYFMRSIYFQDEVINRAPKTTLPILSKGKWELIPIPLPPTKEQARIITKVNQLMVICDELETKLSQSQSDCDELLNVIVNNNENKSSKKTLTHRNIKPISKKTEPNKTTPIDKHTNTPEKKITSTSKPQTKPEKPEKKFDKFEVLKAFRKAIFRQNSIDELSLLRLVGLRLGIKRLSQPIRQELESHINTAIRRKILYRDGDGYCTGAPTIEHYDDDFLIKVLRSVIRKGWEYLREHLVEESTKYLGFDKASDAFKERMESVFRKAIRQKALYRNGAYIGKVSIGL